MAQDKESFLGRWSRLKQEQKVPQEEAPGPAPELPAPETLTPESDFSGFMHPKVEDALRRVALKKLFSDPHFNLPDPYEAYSGDWTVGEPISEEMLATLNQARTLIFNADDKKPAAQEQAGAEPPAAQPPAAQPPEDDEPRRQDT